MLQYFSPKPDRLVSVQPSDVTGSQIRNTKGAPHSTFRKLKQIVQIFNVFLVKFGYSANQCHCEETTSVGVQSQSNHQQSTLTTEFWDYSSQISQLYGKNYVKCRAKKQHKTQQPFFHCDEQFPGDCYELKSKRRDIIRIYGESACRKLTH